jgi:hypothetical protein
VKTTTGLSPPPSSKKNRWPLTGANGMRPSCQRDSEYRRISAASVYSAAVRGSYVKVAVR